MTGSPRQSPKTLRGDASDIVASCAGWNSRLAARRITQYLDDRLAKAGLSVAQLGLMALIAAADDDRLGALAARSGVDPSTLSRNLRTLQREGLVEIAIVEADQRRRAVWLTEAGARKLEAAIPAWRAAHAELSRHMPPELARRLAEAAKRLVPSGERSDTG